MEFFRSSRLLQRTGLLLSCSVSSPHRSRGSSPETVFHACAPTLSSPLLAPAGGRGPHATLQEEGVSGGTLPPPRHPEISIPL